MIRSTLALLALFVLPIANRGANSASELTTGQDPADEAGLENGVFLLEFQWDELHAAEVRETSGSDEKRMDVEYLTRWTTDADAGTTLISFETLRVHMLNGVEGTSKWHRTMFHANFNMLGSEPKLRVNSSGEFVELVDEDERLDALVRLAEFGAKMARDDESFDADQVRKRLRGSLLNQAELRWSSWGGIFSECELREDDSYVIEDEFDGRGSARAKRSSKFSFGQPELVDGVWQVDAECEMNITWSQLVGGEDGIESERVTFAVEELEYSGRYEVETLRPLRARWERSRRTEGGEPSSRTDWREYVFDWNVCESSEGK